MAATDALIDFGIKVITKEGAKIIKSLEILLYPPVGFVSFYNDTDNAVRRIICRVDSPTGNPPQLRQTVIGVVR